MEVPFEAGLFGVEQVGIFDSLDAWVLGQAGDDPKIVGEADGIGVEVQIDIQMFHQQLHAE